MKKLDLKEFRDKGYLLEVNRQFFHPLGLALTIYYDENDPENVNGVEEDATPIGMFIYDCREDEEGNAFADLTTEEDWEKYLNILHEWNAREIVRMERFGWNIQPIGTKYEE